MAKAFDSNMENHYLKLGKDKENMLIYTNSRSLIQFLVFS